MISFLLRYNLLSLFSILKKRKNSFILSSLSICLNNTMIINTTNNILPALLVGEYDIYLDTSSDYNKDDLEEARQELYNKLKDTYL